MCFKCILNVGGTPQVQVYPTLYRNKIATSVVIGKINGSAVVDRL